MRKLVVLGLLFVTGIVYGQFTVEILDEMVGFLGKSKPEGFVESEFLRYFKNADKIKLWKISQLKRDWIKFLMD